MSVGDAGFRILARENSLDHCRIGLAVSRRACPRATGRNRLKRLIRESFRTHQQRIADVTPVDLVIMPRAAAAALGNDEVRHALGRLWAQLASRLERANQQH